MNPNLMFNLFVQWIHPSNPVFGVVPVIYGICRGDKERWGKGSPLHALEKAQHMILLHKGRWTKGSSMLPP